MSVDCDVSELFLLNLLPDYANTSYFFVELWSKLLKELLFFDDCSYISMSVYLLVDLL